MSGYVIVLLPHPHILVYGHKMSDSQHGRVNLPFYGRKHSERVWEWYVYETN